ncbi:uncharacterized protein TNIN_8012, partial [Trichonephila inaurata madagascariensis]
MCKDGDCKNGGTCGKSGVCECLEGTSGKYCELVEDCDSLKCADAEADCVFDVEKKKGFCACRGENQWYVDGKCVKVTATCEKNEDCKNGGVCGDKRVCECLKGTSGEHCEEVTGCKDLNCEGIGAECFFDTETRKATCDCIDGSQLYMNEKCVAKCDKNEDCKNGGICGQKRVCQCLEGTTGERCETVTDCKDMKCENISAECVFDTEIKKATCACKDATKLYVNDKCVTKFCATECFDSRTTCSSINGVDVCICNQVSKYYDYASHTCKEIDKCLTEIECGKNEICSKEKCRCKDYYEYRNYECQRADMCRHEPCFNNTKCKAGEEAGSIICECDHNHAYYNTKRKRCEDSSCFVPHRKKSCYSKCPLGMKRNEDGECESIYYALWCGRDCGPYGWCMKDYKGHDKCYCDPIFAAMKD